MDRSLFRSFQGGQTCMENAESGFHHFLTSSGLEHELLQALCLLSLLVLI